MIHKTIHGETWSQNETVVKASIGDITLVKIAQGDKTAKKRLNQFVTVKERVSAVKSA